MAAIDNAHRLLADRRRGDRSVPALTLEQITEQLSIGVDRVMSEGSLYDRRLAALAIKQARGDLIEAIFLVRAYRTTLPRFGHSEPVDTGAMLVERRVSACYKDLPGGQLLGPTFDYTHRLLDEELEGDPQIETGALRGGAQEPVMRVADILGQEGLIEDDGFIDPALEPGDINQTPTEFPMSRAMRLQSLSRGDEGFLLALGYSTQRGYARSHPFVGEVRIGEVDVEVFMPELGFAVPVGRVQVTECRWSTSSRVRPKRHRSSRAVMALSSASPSARRWRCRCVIVHCARRNWARIWSQRRRTRSSCCRIATTSRPPAS